MSAYKKIVLINNEVLNIYHKFVLYFRVQNLFFVVCPAVRYVFVRLNVPIPFHSSINSVVAAIVSNIIIILLIDYKWFMTIY